LGATPYLEALELQRSLARRRATGELSRDVLLLLEHTPVYTLGRAWRGGNLRLPRELLAARGADVVEVERGGDVTFHGPGQLVGYPVLDLRRYRQDLHWYLRQLEELLIQALGVLGVKAVRNPGFTGVWVPARPGVVATPPEGVAQAGGAWSAQLPELPPPGMRKIASIGVHARDWVTWHGFALNVVNDLSWFDAIVACGIPGVEMTSVARELGGEWPLLFPTVRAAVASSFEDAFGKVLERVELEELGHLR
jgi:lipoate-protein ligase B